MYYQRFAEQANTLVQQIQKVAQGLYLDENIRIQQFGQLLQKDPSLKIEFQSFKQQAENSLAQIQQIQQTSQQLQQKLQKEFGGEPAFPMEIVTDTYLLK